MKSVDIHTGALIFCQGRHHGNSFQEEDWAIQLQQGSVTERGDTYQEPCSEVVWQQESTADFINAVYLSGREAVS